MSERHNHDGGHLNALPGIGGEEPPSAECMPESDCWQMLWEPGGDRAALLGELKRIIGRRISSEPLCKIDRYPDEHRLAPSLPLQEQWQAIKQAITSNQPAEALALLDSLAERLG